MSLAAAVNMASSDCTLNVLLYDKASTGTARPTRPVGSGSSTIGGAARRADDVGTHEPGNDRWRVQDPVVEDDEGEPPYVVGV
jgi:hypothetical protein